MNDPKLDIFQELNFSYGGTYKMILFPYSFQSPIICIVKYTVLTKNARRQVVNTQLYFWKEEANVLLF